MKIFFANNEPINVFEAPSGRWYIEYLVAHTVAGPYFSEHDALTLLKRQRPGVRDYIQGCTVYITGDSEYTGQIGVVIHQADEYCEVKVSVWETIKLSLDEVTLVI